MYKTEPICSLRVPLAEHHLRSNIFRCATNRVSDLLVRVAHLTQPEIGYFYVAVLVQKDVLGLKVPVYYVPDVQVLNSQQDFTGVELSHLLRELFTAPQKIEKFTLYLNFHTPDMRSQRRYSFRSDWNA